MPLMQLRTRGHQFELPAVKYEFNKRNFIVRSLLIMYDLCIFTCIILIFVFHCTHVRMSYVLKALLTYLLSLFILHVEKQLISMKDRGSVPGRPGPAAS